MGELEAKLQECQDYKEIAKLNKEKNDLEPVYECSKQLMDTHKQLNELDELLKTEQDAEMRTMMNEEYTELEKKIPELEHQLKVLLIPKDPMDNRNAIVEIRAGTGGDEAGLFVQDLFAIYQKYCDIKHWKIEIMHLSEGSVGGIKEVFFNVIGKDAYGHLKFESGTHRVQRIPETETQGRVHTSAITVAVFPEVEEFDVEIKESDIRTEPVEQAASTSTKQTAQCGSPTSRQASWFLCRRAVRKSPTASRPCRFCAHAFMNTRRRKKTAKCAPTANCKSAAAIAARKSEPTTIHKTASPTTAST